jgi:Proteasome maturation factor UMP1
MPVSSGLRDVREPFPSFELDMKAPHPIHAILRQVCCLSRCHIVNGVEARLKLPQAPKTMWSERLKSAERAYGTAFAMSMEMDRNILKQFQRGPGLPSSFCGLDTVMGRDERISFEDYLGGSSWGFPLFPCYESPPVNVCVLSLLSGSGSHVFVWLCFPSGVFRFVCAVPELHPDMPSYSVNEQFQRALKM